MSGLEMQSLCSNAVIFRSVLRSTMEAVVTETAIVAAKSFAWSLLMMGTVPNERDLLYKDPDSSGRFPYAELHAVKKVGPENKDGSDTEGDEDDDDDDDDAVDDDDDRGEEEDGSAEEGGEENRDPEDDPEANGDDASGDDEEEEEDDDDDDGEEDEEEEEEEDEEDEEEIPQPPTKKRK